MIDLSKFAVPVPVPAFIGTLGTVLMAVLIVIVARHYDVTGGLLTLSILIVVGFITASFASMIYNIPDNAAADILLGALATSVGAVVAYWMSGHKGGE